MTNGTTSDQGAQITDDGTIVWTRYDFCPNRWQAAIMLRDVEGEISRLSDGSQPQVPSISSAGVVGWSDGNDLYVWKDGSAARLTDNGRNPLINSRGDVAFIRWNPDTASWESWLYLGGEFRPIARSDQWEISYDMNEAGDIVVQSCTAALDQSEVVLYQRLPDGDLNCDERVDFDDIDGFVAALTNRADYEQRFPDCDWWLADMTGNRSVDFDDIDGFIDCLVDGGCERK